MNSDVIVNVGDRSVEHLEPFHDAATWRVLLAETDPLTPTGGRISRIGKPLEATSSSPTTMGSRTSMSTRSSRSIGRTESWQGVTDVRPASRFGELRLRGDLVSEFREKPQLEEGWINGGYFVFKREALRYGKPDSTLEPEPLGVSRAMGSSRSSGTRATATDRHDARTSSARRGVGTREAAMETVVTLRSELFGLGRRGSSEVKGELTHGGDPEVAPVP